LLPPFALTGILTSLLAATACFRARKARPAPPALPSETPPFSDQLGALRQSYRRGELSEQLLFERIFHLVCAALQVENHFPLTSKEVVAAAGGKLSGEALARVASLFDRCDAVRFGGETPGRGDAEAALDRALAVLAGTWEEKN
jgi:hypothetical protein